MRKQKLFMLFAMSLLFSALSVAAQNVSKEDDKKFVKFADKFPNSYVVTLKDSATGGLNNKRKLSEVAGVLAAKYNGKITNVYGASLNGFSIEMNERQAISLSRDELVEAVYEDAKATPDTLQTNATWGLDRIDQRPLPLNTNYNYTPTGAGVNVYVIDSGINYTHSEFGGRAVPGADFVSPGTNGKDCMGHGTHVAGTIGGATYGVAKNAKLYSVRVFGCSGGSPLSTILNAIDWVTLYRDISKPAVVNMSLGFGAVVAPVNTAVNNSINQGITYVVAAGNSNLDACGVSPASTPNAITVGASTNTDAKAVFSNFGKCVDIFAPGDGITSAWFTTNTATNVLPGTSMASPHVAGTAALYLQNAPTAKPAEVTQEILCSASSNKLTSIGVNSPNLLLFSPLIWEPGKKIGKFIEPRCGYKAAPKPIDIKAF